MSVAERRCDVTGTMCVPVDNDFCLCWWRSSENERSREAIFNHRRARRAMMSATSGKKSDLVKEIEAVIDRYYPPAPAHAVSDDISASTPLPTRSVPDALAELGKIYRERNAVYGDTYKLFGRVMVGFFPRPVTLATMDDWNRMALFFHCADKLARYAGSFARGGHVDSLDDNSVYSQMLQEFDADVRAGRTGAADYVASRGTDQ